MKLNVKDVKNARQWQSTLGVSAKEFEHLLKTFEKCYIQKHQMSLQESMNRLGVEQPIFSTYEECLFFVLFQLKNALTFDVLGLIFGTNGGNAQRNFERNLLILEAVLSNEKALPAREFATVEALNEFLKSEKDIICDGTEFSTERPKNKEKQKAAYSGKKKRM
jgi:hypothetical protein